MNQFNLNSKKKDTFFIDDSEIDSYNWNIIKETNISKIDFELYKFELESKFKDFLEFLQFKGLIKDGEYEEFLQSKLIAKKLGDSNEF